MAWQGQWNGHPGYERVEIDQGELHARLRGGRQQGNGYPDRGVTGETWGENGPPPTGSQYDNFYTQHSGMYHPPHGPPFSPPMGHHPSPRYQFPPGPPPGLIYANGCFRPAPQGPGFVPSSFPHQPHNMGHMPQHHANGAHPPHRPARRPSNEVPHPHPRSTSYESYPIGEAELIYDAADADPETEEGVQKLLTSGPDDVGKSFPADRTPSAEGKSHKRSSNRSRRSTTGFSGADKQSSARVRSKAPIYDQNTDNKPQRAQTWAEDMGTKAGGSTYPPGYNDTNASRSKPDAQDLQGQDEENSPKREEITRETSAEGSINPDQERGGIRSDATLILEKGTEFWLEKQRGWMKDWFEKYTQENPTSK